MTVAQHNDAIQKNLAYWDRKPLLRRVYRDFYQRIASHLSNAPQPRVVEIGSGIGKSKDVIPNSIQTDLFPNPWLDLIENAYRLSFASSSISDLILFDVFHHLRYPGTALAEFQRVLMLGGRVIIFDPCISLLGLIVYGLFHPEPIALTTPMQWGAPTGWSPEKIDYYAAQGNAWRVFTTRKYRQLLQAWELVAVKQFSAIAYVASGGYSKPQLLPNALFPLLKASEKVCDLFPFLFATRLLVVLEKSA